MDDVAELATDNRHLSNIRTPWLQSSTRLADVLSGFYVQPDGVLIDMTYRMLTIFAEKNVTIIYHP